MEIVGEPSAAEPHAPIDAAPVGNQARLIADPRRSELLDRPATVENAPVAGRMGKLLGIADDRRPMTMAEVTSPEAVRAAAREFGALGKEAFLYEYGVGPPGDCVVVIDGRLYPAQALFGAAHGHQYLDIRPLADSDFGGLSETAVKLSELGFEVRRRGDDHEV